MINGFDFFLCSFFSLFLYFFFTSSLHCHVMKLARLIGADVNDFALLCCRCTL